MKLYKFRPLANDTHFGRIKTILTTGKFWCSKFSALNDPMEGFYAFSRNSDISEKMKKFYNKTEQNKICSFSGEKAFYNPIMWGYYANGFRGVAIEIEVDSNKVEQIDYDYDDIPILNGEDTDAKKILTTKIRLWEHEDEYRFMEKSHSDDIGESKEIEIGKITALCFGDPYGNARNKEEIIENSKDLKNYIKLRDEILNISKELELYSVEIKDCKVKKIPFKKNTKL